MTWNYRVIKQTVNGDTFSSIHEVYYDENGEIRAYAEVATSVVWFEDEKFDDLLKKLKTALENPELEKKELDSMLRKRLLNKD